MSDQKQNYLHGAAILAAGTVIIKILGAIYKIPLGNILGDEGYAHFMVAYNIYNVFLTVATAGLPVALSRMISEAHTLNRQMQVRRIFSVSLGLLMGIGAVSALVMFLFPAELAAIMNGDKAAQSIWALSPGIFFVCLVAAYRGYSQGHSNMRPTTVSQIIEVLVKVVVGLTLAVMLTSAGKGLPVASAGAIFGVTAGGFVALIYLIFSKRKNYPNKPVSSPDTPDSTRRILYNILRIGIPITLGSSVLSLISLIDTKLVLNRLQFAAGFASEQADVLYGIYGKAQTLYNLPATFITTLTISIVPAIVAEITRYNSKGATEIAESSMRISSVLAMPMAVGLMVLSYPIINVLYPGSNEAGPMLLLLLGAASFFVCLALMTNAVLQAHGLERYPVYSMIAGGVVKIAVNWYLVSIPSVNIYGAPIGTLCCYIVMCAMNYIFMRRLMEHKPSIKKIMLRPVISSAAMGVTAFLSYEAVKWLAGNPARGLFEALAGVVSRVVFKEQTLSYVADYLGMAVAMLAAILAAVIVYLIAVVKTRAITMDDMRLIPKGEKLGKLMRVRESS